MVRGRVLVAVLLTAAVVGMVDGAAPVGAVAADTVLGSQVGGPAPPAASGPVGAVDEPAPVPVRSGRTGMRSAAVRTIPLMAAGTPCRGTARACVDLSARQAWLIRDGVVVHGPVPITSGRRGYRTPPGTFRVTFRNIDHVSSIYDAPMPYSVFFNGGIAFHQGSLSELSHGCIHLSRSAAREFYGSLRTGDVVQVTA